ncbi:family 16 glycosylhydrolase [Bifidobacterium vansinderenii]|uniref:LGFP repeat n=1 Tax=Bifidobacterium vansinderenii TaxID=1984871 RepID=A0A229VVS4_9BIFI|nr:family 16 glycosylhydrolase [Bifidobacterium vansinderenii]OXM99727.1 LGFP repeat [Bifidobacterium vansinderenii]
MHVKVRAKTAVEYCQRLIFAILATCAMVLGVTIAPPMALAANATTTTPKGPTFRDDIGAVYIPADQGVRYHIYQYEKNPNADGSEGSPALNRTEVTWPDSGFDYAKPGTYTADQGLAADKLVVVTAVSAGSATVLDGTTQWAHLLPDASKQLTFNDESTTITVPDITGVDFYVGGAKTNPGEVAAQSSAKTTVTAVTSADVTDAPNIEVLNQEHTFPTVVTPKGPKFDDNAGTVYIPSDQGVRYYINIGDKLIVKEGLPYSKPGTYTTADGIESGKEIVVTAKSAGSTTILTGTTEWKHTFAIVAAAPSFDDEKATVTIPETQGVSYYIDNATEPATAGVHNGKAGVKMTVTAKSEDGTTLNTWSHTFPSVVTPKGPKFDDNAGTVYIPSDQGVRYYIVIDGKTITKEGYEFSKPGTYTTADGIVAGKEITVTAKSAGSSTVLTGTTEWKHTLAARPDSSIANGDEFNDASPLVNKNWKILNQNVPTNKNTNVVYRTDGVQVKDGVLNIITERHCLADGETPSAANAQAEPCGNGKRTVYTSGRIESGFDYKAPFVMEVRAKMADPNNGNTFKGMHFSAWIRNNQKYCGKDVASSDIAELDTMEVYSDQAATTNTSHVSCVAGPNGEDWTSRDTHVMGAKLVGEWHTYKMVWDGKAIEYFFDGKAVPLNGTNGETKTTAATLNMSEEKFRRVLNDYPWQIIVNNNVFGKSDWKAGPDDSKRFDPIVNQVDYVRINPIADANPNAPRGAIAGYWQSNRWLGDPTGAEISVKGGASQTFQNGTVFWSSRTGETHAVKGAILSAYGAQKWEQGRLGFPTSDERSLNGGASQSFENGQIHWSGGTGAHATFGAIQGYWSGAGWENGWLGYPTGDELAVKGGASQTFQGGTLFWSGSTGTHALKGAILNAYAAQRYEQGKLGFPTSDERSLNGGASQSFQNGQVHWSGSTGAHATFGAIQGYWSDRGWENGWLGYPTGDELSVRGGASQSFQGGTVFWQNGGGTHGVKGAIRDKYSDFGWEQGKLGFPISEENTGLKDGGASQVFEHGQIHWSGGTGAHATFGAIQDHWASTGWENGWLGYPTSDEINDSAKAGEVYQNFQGGQVHWGSSVGAYTSSWGGGSSGGGSSNGGSGSDTGGVTGPIVHRGAFCSPEGALGISDGKDRNVLVCKIAKDNRLRWQNLK